MRYTIRTLLMPLGFEPRWTGRAQVRESGGLYYGPSAEFGGDGVVPLAMDPEATGYFARRNNFPTGRVRWEKWGGNKWPVLFGMENQPDLVASAFFWLSGWQEYTTDVRDEHGRFPFDRSLQSSLGTAIRPAVDAYREMLADRLEAAGYSARRRKWGGASWALCPTHDIDYLRKWRPGMIYREIVDYALRNQQRVGVADRLRRLRAFATDFARPGDVYRKAFIRLQEETTRVGGTSTFFVKTGAHDPHDVPYSTRDAFLLERISSLQAAGFEIGLHPSYLAPDHAEWMREESKALATIVDAVSVRQHYLRYDAAITPHLQRNAGFRIDSTLGFAEHEGFRHATCLPFQLFDIPANERIDVWEMPLSMMEATLFNRRHLSFEDACEETRTLASVCARFGGVMVGLWHNTVWDELDCPGWGAHFIETLRHSREDNGAVLSLQDALSAYLGPQ